MKKLKQNSICTEKIKGTVVNIVVRGLEKPTTITVRYEVANKSYEIEETIKLKNEVIKLGFLPIGQRQVPAMGDTAVGSLVNVMYNPNNPAEAYLPDNIGKINA